MKKLYKIQVWLLTLLFTTTMFAQNSSNSVFNVKLDNYLQNGQKNLAAQMMEEHQAPHYDFNQVTIPLKGKSVAYCYVAYDPSNALPEGPASFDLSDATNVTSLAPSTTDQFITSGTWANGKWYGEEYNTGNLYTINEITGEFTLVGNANGEPGLSFNGMAYVGETMYACTSDKLYTIDLTNGQATLVGSMGNGGTMIGLASDGTILYGVDLASDKLYTIDPSSGTATEVGSLGINLNYAQDADYDRNTNTLYLSAYVLGKDGGALYTVDVATGAATFVADFPGGAEITGFAIPYQTVAYDKDLAIVAITSPASGVDLGTENVSVVIMNKGQNEESNFDVTYTLDGGATVTETVTETLQPGDTYEYTFGQTVDLSAYGTYSIEACVNLDGDENPDNDCFSKTVENAEPSLCVDGLYTTGCSLGDGLTYWSLENVTLDIPCDGDPYPWYHDFRGDMNKLISLAPGQSYDLVAKCGYSNTILDVWIDYNDDLYMSEDEHIIDDYWMEDSDTEYSINFTIPADAPAGQHVLRYRTNWSTSGAGIDESCETHSYGNMCDFTTDLGGGAPIFADDFDAYTAGEQLACQNPDDWTTWSNAPCDATEDPFVSADQANSAPNSVNIVDNNDLVKLFYDADSNYYTSGKYKISFYMYIPTGNDAYWNLMQDFGASNVWGFEAYYNNGQGTVNANGTNPATTFTYPYDTWMLTEVCVDLNNDNAKFMIDGNVIYEWPWSVGTSNSNLLQLAAADFYGYHQTNACSYYIDDFKFEELEPGAPTLDPPTNVMAVANNNEVTVTWESPAPFGQWISWGEQESTDAIGLTDGGTFIAASRWDPEDLTDYDGEMLTKIAFFVGDSTVDPTTYSVMIWQGGDTPTLIATQDVPSINVGEWNLVTLDSPVPIDATQGLWFGYEVTSPAGSFPAGTDDGPAVAGKGDLLSFDGTNWVTLSGYNIDRNWSLAGYVMASTKATAELRPLVKKTIANPATPDQLAVNKVASANNLAQSKDLLLFNVYRDGEFITTVNDTVYVDSGLPEGTYTYCVSAQYDEGESDLACADPVEVVPGPAVIYEDDFEAYTAGEMVACQNPDNWTTWDNNPCSGTDAYVSSDVANSGSNSVNIVNDNDLVYPIDDYTEGYYKLSFYTYIPTGNDAYWNVLQSFNDGNFAWGMEVLYNKDVEGEASVSAGGTAAATFNFAYDTWMYNEVYINLYTDNAQFFVDGNMVVEWQWSTGANGNGTLNALGGVDFYGWSGGVNANCNYYFDDFKLEQLEYELPDPPTNVQAMANADSVVVTWSAPGGGNGGSEFADGFESGNFDAWGEMIEGTGTPGETGASPYWHIGDFSPYEGAYKASCDWGYTIDTWLISPPIEAANNTAVTFAWNGSYYWSVDPNDNGDLFVKVSTDGGNSWDELWTFGNIGEWENWTWYQTTVDLSAYAGQTILVAFNNVGDDNAEVSLDDVYIGENSKAFGTYAISSTPQLDEKIKSLPKDVAYTFNNTKDLLGYNIFRNGELISYVDAGQNTYTDLGLATGVYTYCVSAVYEEGESVKACADPVEVEAPCLPAPMNLTGPASVEDGNPIDLTWDAPGVEGWMQWDSGENNGNGIGLGANAGTYYCASHWMPEDLAPYAGQYITKIVFYYNNSDTEATFVVKVWKGANAATEVVSQPVTAEGEWNEVILDTPVLIDCSQELWFGYEVTQEYGYPAGTDDGPAVQTKGDMISFDAANWVSMSAQYGLDYNFNIAAYASANGNKGAVAVPLAKTTVENPTVANVTSTTFKPQTPVYEPFNVEPVSVKSPNSYNVYRDGALIGNTTETMYSDDTYGGEGQYQYYVTAVYDQGESDPSNTVTVQVVTGLDENHIDGLTVYPNPAKDHLNIAADVNINNVMLYNFAGQVIVNTQVNNNAYMLNASNLNPGVYMLRIDTEKGSVTKRIIIE